MPPPVSGVSGDRGVLAALEAILETFDSPDLPDLPPLHAGLVGYLGYDVVREVEHLPGTPPDDLGHPDAILAVIGQLAAFDHWRQRVVLIDNVVIDPSWSAEALDAAHHEAVDRLDELAAECFRPLYHAPRPLPERAPAPPDVHRTMSDSLYEEAVRAAKEHVTAGDVFQVVLSQRFDLDDARDRPLRRLPRPAPGQPEPVPLLPALPRGHRGGRVPRAHGAPA